MGLHGWNVQLGQVQSTMTHPETIEVEHGELQLQRSPVITNTDVLEDIGQRKKHELRDKSLNDTK
jgi:hypothetical protein